MKPDTSETVDAVGVEVLQREKRDLYDAVRPYDPLSYSDRDRRVKDRQFDPFLFGSSDRFSHGFGKRSVYAMALVGSLRSPNSIN